MKSKNLIKYVLSTTLSSICFFLFTIIDGIFVGHGVGTNALGAVNLVFPFVMVINALFMLTTVGGVTISAIRLGRGDREGANQAFIHSVYFNAFISVFLCVVGTCFCDQICTLLGAKDSFRQMGKDYLFWYSVFILPSGLSTTLQGFCRNDGSPGLVSIAVIASTLFNIVGDWLLIFPVPWGLKGAAIATGLSQVLALLVVLTHFLRKKGSLYFSRPQWSFSLIKKILVRGLPECIAQLSTPVTTFCINLVLMREIGELGVNAFSLISYIASFSVAIFFGTSEGLQPLFGQSYGAKNEEDLTYYFHAGLLINLIGSCVIYILLFFVGGSVCRLFGTDEATMQFTVALMPSYAWGFIFMALNVMISAYLYSTKRSKQAIALNTLRSVVIHSLVILLLPSIWGAKIIWFTFGIYEFLVSLVAIWLLKRSERNGILFQ